MNDRPANNTPRPHKPVPFSPADFEQFAGGIDPARVSEAAHLAARALVHSGRASNDPEVTKRLVKLADKQGLEAIAEMWAASPARSLPGALWRLYALRAATLQDPEGISVFFRAGQQKAQVANAVAGVAEPPGAEEITTMANAILSGAFDGDFDVALERSAAFCRVVALGQATMAVEREAAHGEHAAALTRKAHQLVRTAEDLEGAAKSWRKGELD
ncbi:hypothetical protein [Arthrobacter glacialis]|uniref:DNA-directed RNA polymerase subunit beta n=1 Tax=Arthrobacter glacialis TaxID=1664 RepID=A0A2S3ZYD8_ARTGL|nr:hypothetical protein [Arthrobacter glacialis]POH59302.1 hypothetical protein CVS28_07445 [Arthrobacter glacialis]POH73932.1 hypothetical protein CVS27_08445 [Arthrobacter glacialis]